MEKLVWIKQKMRWCYRELVLQELPGRVVY